MGRFPDNTITAERPGVHRNLVTTLATKIMLVCPAIDQLVAVLEQYMTDLEDYQIGFLPLLLWLMLSVFVLLLSRESFCRQQIYDKITSHLSTQSSTKI